MDVLQEMIVPTKKESLVDVVHNAILEIIIQEEVTEASVFTESKLVQQFSVSKPTIREALVRLCNENILKSVPRYGYVIVRLSEKDYLDLCEFRILLEISALEKSFQHIVDHHLDTVKQMLHHHQQVPSEKVWDVWKKNIEFHSLLVSFTGNDVYVEYLEKTMKRQALSFAQNKWKDERTFDDQLYAEPHRLILEAFMEHDFQKAMEYLKTDILSAFSFE